MSSLREQGMAALKEGNLDGAVDFLARAVLSDDNDVEAKALLGIAYSQKGLHAQAKRALQTAVEREPQNQNFRFNLAVVLERGGDAQGAALAYRDVLQINPQHPQARAKLQALGPAAQQLLGGAPAGAPPGAPLAGAPPPGMPPAGPPGYAPPPPPGYGGAPPAYGHGAPMAPPGAPPMGAPPMGAPPIGGPPMSAPAMGAPPAYGAPPIGAPMGAPPGYGQPPMGGPPMGAPMGAPMGGPPGFGGPGMAAPPGTIQCPSCAQFSKLGMLCEFCNAPLPPPPKQAPPPPPSYGPAPMGGRPMTMGAGVSEDDFNVGDGFQAWGRTLISPSAFFQEQVGIEGIKGPSAYVLAFAVAFHITNVVAGLMMGEGLGGRRIGSLFFGWACLYLLFMIGYFVWGALVHAGSKIVGGQADYSGSFRAGAFGSAPYALMMVLSIALLPLVVPKQSDLDKLNFRSVPHVIQQAQIAPPQYAQAGPLLQGGPRFPSGPTTSGPTGGAADRSAAAAIAAQILSRFGLLAILLFVGWIWSLVTTGIGVANIHSIGGGQAAGAVVIAVILNILIWVGLSFTIGAAILSAIQGRLGG